MILVDADIICYRLGYATENDPDASEKLVKAMVNTYVDNMLQTIVEKHPRYTEFYMFLTGKANFRNEIAVTAPYKGNRTKQKPRFIPTIREHLIQNFEAVVSENEEADDAIAIKATENRDNCLICSVDKDFLQVPGHHYNFVTNTYQTVSDEEGMFNFYQQILTGDRVDNIIGLTGIGPVKSKKLLEGLSEQEMYDKCVELYDSEERVIENARLLWLRREEGQIWSPPYENSKQEEETDEEAT